MERIMKETGIQQNDFSEYKKIKYISHIAEVKKPYYIQRMEHIRKLLNILDIDKAH